MWKQATSKLKKLFHLDEGQNSPRKAGLANCSKMPMAQSPVTRPPNLSTFPLSSPFGRTLTEDNSDGVVLLTAYDDDQVGRVFLLAYQSEEFIDFLDALTDNGNLNCVKVIPPVGTVVVARIGIDGDERDDVPFLRKIGGIHNKPWRGIITQKEGGSLDKDSNKAWITITDLGISQYVDMSDIFLPSEEISSIPLDKFGCWVHINNVDITNENRMFYRSTYRNLMDSLLYSELHVVKVNEDSTGIMKLDLKCANEANPATLIVQLQHWEYERVEKKVTIKNSKSIVEAIHGRGTRVKFFDIMQPLCLSIGKIYKGTVTTSEKSSKIFLFRVLEDEEISDNIRIWNLHVFKYCDLISHCSSWYPVVDEVFLMQRGTKSQTNSNNEDKNCRWRRVMRNLTHIWDLDDAKFFVTLDEVSSSCIMRPAPKDLLNLPMGHARILIPGYKFKSDAINENFVRKSFPLRVVSYDLDNLAHIVEVDDNVLEWAKKTWLEAA